MLLSTRLLWHFCTDSKKVLSYPQEIHPGPSKISNNSTKSQKNAFKKTKKFNQT